MSPKKAVEPEVITRTVLKDKAVKTAKTPKSEKPNETLKTAKTAKPAKTDQISEPQPKVAVKVKKIARLAKPKPAAKVNQPAKTAKVVGPAQAGQPVMAKPLKFIALSKGQRIHERRMKQAARQENAVYHSLTIRRVPTNKA